MTKSLMVAGLVLAASVAGAQSSTSAPAPSKRPRVGYAGTPAPEPPRPAQPQYAPPIYYTPNGYGVVAAPFITLADGSILANFGNGYERVLRQCAPPQQPVNADQTGRDPLGRILPPPGIAALQQGSRGQVYGQVPERNVGACYRTNSGRAEVVRQ